MTNSSNTASAKQALTNQVAQVSGVAEEDVAKVLDAMGLNKHHDQALQLSGKSEFGLDDVTILYRVGANTIVR